LTLRHTAFTFDWFADKVKVVLLAIAGCNVIGITQRHVHMLRQNSHFAQGWL
jgi:hypothetical protein